MYACLNDNFVMSMERALCQHNICGFCGNECQRDEQKKKKNEWAFCVILCSGGLPHAQQSKLQFQQHVDTGRASPTIGQTASQSPNFPIEISITSAASLSASETCRYAITCVFDRDGHHFPRCPAHINHTRATKSPIHNTKPNVISNRIAHAIFG